MTNARAQNYREIGDTTLAVFQAELDRLGSPWRDKAASIYAIVSPHAALALAMGSFENKWGTTGHIIKPADNNPFSSRPWDEDPRATANGVEIAWDTRKPTGRLVAVPPGAAGTVMHPKGGSFLRFATIEAAALEWRRRLFDDPGYKGGVYTTKRTLKEMIDTYSPPGDVHPVTGADNADIQYVASVQAMLDRYQAAEGGAPAPSTGGGTVSTYQPKIIDKWLHVAQNDYPAVIKYNKNRNGNRPRAIVVHVQEGSNWGSWTWFHQVQASCTVMVAKNGDIWRLVEERHGPWTNGDVKNPDATVRKMMADWGGDPNDWTLTIECEGFTGNLPYTEEQYQSVLWQIREWRKAYGNLPLLRHGQINSVDRFFCCEGPGGPLMARLHRDLDTPAPAPPPAPKPEPVTLVLTQRVEVRQDWQDPATVIGHLEVGDEVVLREIVHTGTMVDWVDVGFTRNPPGPGTGFIPNHILFSTLRGKE